MIVQSTTLDTEEKVKAIYGGIKWVKIEGRFLLGQSPSYAINSIGGEVSHTLTVGELPNHSHTIPSLNGSTNSSGAHTHKIYTKFADKSPWDGVMRASVSGGQVGGTSEAGEHSHTVTTNASNTGTVGSSSAHNNMPPYKVVYIWERTK